MKVRIGVVNRQLRIVGDRPYLVFGKPTAVGFVGELTIDFGEEPIVFGKAESHCAVVVADDVAEDRHFQLRVSDDVLLIKSLATGDEKTWYQAPLARYGNFVESEVELIVGFTFGFKRAEFKVLEISA